MNSDEAQSLFPVGTRLRWAKGRIVYEVIDHDLYARVKLRSALGMTRWEYGFRLERLAKVIVEPDWWFGKRQRHLIVHRAGCTMIRTSDEPLQDCVTVDDVVERLNDLGTVGLHRACRRCSPELERRLRRIRRALIDAGLNAKASYE